MHVYPPIAPFSAVEQGGGHGSEIYAVRLCQNTVCLRMVWNRDVKVAINMLNLAIAFFEGHDKPEAFGQNVQVH